MAEIAFPVKTKEVVITVPMLRKKLANNKINISAVSWNCIQVAKAEDKLLTFKESMLIIRALCSVLYDIGKTKGHHPELFYYENRNQKDGNACVARKDEDEQSYASTLPFWDNTQEETNIRSISKYCYKNFDSSLPSRTVSAPTNQQSLSFSNEFIVQTTYYATLQGDKYVETPRCHVWIKPAAWRLIQEKLDKMPNQEGEVLKIKKLKGLDIAKFCAIAAINMPVLKQDHFDSVGAKYNKIKCAIHRAMIDFGLWHQTTMAYEPVRNMKLRSVIGKGEKKQSYVSYRTLLGEIPNDLAAQIRNKELSSTGNSKHAKAKINIAEYFSAKYDLDLSGLYRLTLTPQGDVLIGKQDVAARESFLTMMYLSGYLNIFL